MVISDHEDILLGSAIRDEVDVVELDQVVRLRPEERLPEGAGHFPSPFSRKAVDA